MKDKAFPQSADDAVARGYRPIGTLAAFLKAQATRRKAALTADEAAPLTTAAADCQNCPAGTKCYDADIPGQGHIVGYCDANGQCQLYQS